MQLVAGHPNWEERGFEGSKAHLEIVERLCIAKADPRKSDRHGTFAALHLGPRAPSRISDQPWYF